MANKKLRRAVMVGSTTFRRGEEEDLDRALTAAQVKALKKARILEGDFTGKSKGDVPSREEYDRDATVRAGAASNRRRAKLREEARSRDPSPKEKEDEFKPTITGEGDPIPDDFPARSELEAAGIKTLADVKANADNLEKIPGIGSAKAKQIREQG